MIMYLATEEVGHAEMIAGPLETSPEEAEKAPTTTRLWVLSSRG